MKSFDIDEYNYRECEVHNHGFYLGEQSKQAEVDELQKNFNNALKTIEIQQRFLDDADGANKVLTSQASELQKRIDEALEAFDDGSFNYCRKILKGNTNDH